MSKAKIKGVNAKRFKEWRRPNGVEFVKMDATDERLINSICFTSIKKAYTLTMSNYFYNMIYSFIQTNAKEDYEDLKQELRIFFIKHYVITYNGRIRDLRIYKYLNKYIYKIKKCINSSCYIEDETGELEKVSIQKYLYNSLSEEKHSKHYSELEYLFKRCKLTDAEKELITMKTNSNLKLEEIAKLTGRAPSTTRVLFKRAKEKIRQELLKEEY